VCGTVNNPRLLHSGRNSELTPHALIAPFFDRSRYSVIPTPGQDPPNTPPGTSNTVLDLRVEQRHVALAALKSFQHTGGSAVDGLDRSLAVSRHPRSQQLIHGSTFTFDPHQIGAVVENDRVGDERTLLGTSFWGSFTARYIPQTSPGPASNTMACWSLLCLSNRRNNESACVGSRSPLRAP
jgi:hypothetical protein